MGDPLSIAASVAGLITISAQIVGMAKELFGKVKDAPETVMQMREEVESMQPIFSQVQLLLNGSGKGVNHANLTMISVHNLMSTLTGCVIVYDKLEKKVNEVCGFNDPTTACALWKRAGVIADRVKWGLWRHEEVMCIIEDLQRQKRSLNLMVTIITCTTTTETSARLQEICMENLQSSHAHSVLLRELISRQDEQARILEEIRDRPCTTTLGGTSSAVSTSPSSTVLTRPSSAGSNPFATGNPFPTGKPSGHRDNSDNASMMSKRSTLSLRLSPPSYMEDLKASRAYKRLRHFGREIDSSSESVFSLGSGCSTGNWSMLSDMTLGDLSVSQIAVLNLPIDLSDVSNPEPFQDRLSMEIPRSPKSQSKRSSRGRIHNAIENGNVFVVRTLLAIGGDIEELDSSGRTPLVHAAVKHQEAICKLLLEKGASVETLKSFTSGMDFKAKSELLDPLITRCLDDGSTSAYVSVLRLLVPIVFGTDGGEDDNGSSSQSIMKIAIDMNYGLAVRAIIYIEPRVLVKVDIEDRAPFAYAYHLRRNEICELLLQRSIVDIETAATVVRFEDDFAGRVHAVFEEKCHHLLWLLLASAAFNNKEDLCALLVEKGYSLYLDTKQKKQLIPKLSCRIHVAAKGGNKTVLQLLLDMGADINERSSKNFDHTALLEAVFYNNLSCVKLLIERGADATISTSTQRTVLHRTAFAGHEQIMKFLLDVVETRKLVDVKDSYGDTALHDCRYFDGRPAAAVEIAEMLLQAGATLTIKNNAGETPYECARSRRKKELAKYLWSQLSPKQRPQETPPPSDC